MIERWPLAAVAVFVLAVTVSCAPGPETAGNRTIWFFGDLQLLEYEDAYEQLCPALRADIGRDAFVESKGDIFKPVMDDLRGLLGADKEYPDEDTIDKSITEAWTEVTGTRDDDATYRIHLERDGSRWSVCGVERR